MLSNNTIGIQPREVLKPLTYFNQKPLEQLREHLPINPESRACAFLDLHRKLTLNFTKSRGEY
jgi:hypothetical protein